MFTMLRRPFTDCFYIELTNNASYDVVFEVNFVFRGKQQYLKSLKLKLYDDDRLCIPLTATNINLTISIFQGVARKIILNERVFHNKNYCLVTQGDFRNPRYRDVPCD